VAAEFGDAVMVLDGGACSVGIESTIVDCRGTSPVLLRPGQLGRAEIEAVAGQPFVERDASAPRVSGSLDAHYAPRATLRLMDIGMLKAAMQVLGTDAPGVAVYSRSLPPDPSRRLGLRWRRMPTRADEAARELFSVLRDFDAEGARLIWVEEPPATPDWDGVRDRNDGRLIGLVYADIETQNMYRFPLSFTLTNVVDSACLDTAPPPACTTSTLATSATSAGYLWAAPLLLGPTAQARLGTVAASRARNNPF
jgi:hypothetical protein